MSESALRPNPATIMIVDDMVENLWLLQSMLKEAGYDVRPAPSGVLLSPGSNRQGLLACPLEFCGGRNVARRRTGTDPHFDMSRRPSRARLDDALPRCLRTTSNVG